MPKICIALLVLLLTACSRGDGERLVITGSSTVAPLVNEMARRYAALQPGLRIEVQTGGSSRGISDARSGLADIGMVSRALRDDETDLLATPIARDGIALIVHADKPVAALSADEVRAIFTGQVSDWSAVGGAPGPITVINKAEGRSTLELFLAYFALDNPAIQADVVIGDNEQGIKTLVSDVNAIAYVSIGSAEFAERRGEPLRRLPMGGVTAGIAQLRDGSFPLSRTLNLVTRPDASTAVSAFLDYARSPAVHDLIEQQAFVPLP